MKKMKRIAALVCIFAILFTMAGCSKFQVSREIATVNGRTIAKAEYMYYLENVKQQMLAESGTLDAESFWNAEIDGEKASELAKKRALEEAIRVEIGCIKAEESGLSIPAADLSQIRSMINSTDAEQKAQVDYIKGLTGLSNQQLIDMLCKTALASMYGSEYNDKNPEALVPTDEEVKAVYEQEYVRVKHVLIGNTDESEVEHEDILTEEEKMIAAEAYKAMQQEKAAEVLQKAKAGANFDSLVREYGEDPGMEESPDGYTFTKGTMVAEFEDAAYALAVSEVSDLVETSFGWHIIKKYALPTSGEDYEYAKESITAALSQEKYNAVLDAFKPEMTVEIRQSVLNGIKVK
ncbi:MAG: peptidylprolyl isomerase [Clostridia bacterium]|nr:peptidylprolyl isomerase [Clostridia bacterium]